MLFNLYLYESWDLEVYWNKKFEGRDDFYNYLFDSWDFEIRNLEEGMVFHLFARYLKLNNNSF